jgi:four helix bundle protein
MKNFKDLIVWQKAHVFVLAVYKTTRSFPKEELFNLTSQLRRAGTSIPTNLAEGCGRFSQKEFARYIQIALGSALEIEYLVFLSFELGYLSFEDYKKSDNDINEIKAMMINLLRKVRRSELKVKS